MRIVIDMQALQGENGTRGIGRYVRELVRSLVLNSGDHEVILALNDAMPESVQSIRQEFSDVLPSDQVYIWKGLSPVAANDPANRSRQTCSELIREAFLRSLHPSVVVVPSLFEGFYSECVTSVKRFDDDTPQVVLLHDLIPLIYRTHYLKAPYIEEWYSRKLYHLKQADLWLANSDSTLREACEYAQIPASSIVNIAAAAGCRFRPTTVTDADRRALWDRTGIRRPFLMYTGGVDWRKNLEGLIEAYSLLSSRTREVHQLAIVCSIEPNDQARLIELARNFGLQDDEVVFTGFVSEQDLIGLYNTSEAFVFPSLHEGFGLPALEAMSCGRAVIGANRSSLPEVIGRPDALFDPYCVKDIARSIDKVLTDSSFRESLEEHSIVQARRFSWEATAKKALGAIEELVSNRGETHRQRIPTRPRLAYISPLPPERTGISGYSSVLIPELQQFYDIDVIVAQDSVEDPWIEANCSIRGADWFVSNSSLFDRVIYHFGNSAFHGHMFDLLKRVPGIVVLHDFFLSGLISDLENRGYEDFWTHALYNSHGYPALRSRFCGGDPAATVWRYPCNLEVLQRADGVIVHSEYSRQLARTWYGEPAGRDWELIPLLRPLIAASPERRNVARAALNIDESEFLVCSFGMIGANKMTDRLLEAWFSSSLAADRSCRLLFVGENDSGDFGQSVLERIQQAEERAEGICITGWTDQKTFEHYLAAADVAVQLRTRSRGETSAAVLDCMNWGLPTIINANGSMVELPIDSVWQLEDSFQVSDLADAIESLKASPNQRKALSTRSVDYLHRNHRPSTCAHQYFEAIERVHRNTRRSFGDLARCMSSEAPGLNNEDLITAAQAIDSSIPARPARKQILVDVSELIQRDAGTGIQRVVRQIIERWLAEEVEGYRVEPVYALTDAEGYRYAKEFTLQFIGCPDVLTDDPVSYRSGDVFVGLDLQPNVIPAQSAYLQRMRRAGVRVLFVVYDLLCTTLPHTFPVGAQEQFTRWLRSVAACDGVICISRSVADEFRSWLEQDQVPVEPGFSIEWFHLGADFSPLTMGSDLPHTVKLTGELERIRASTSFLMVGTIEPRKGHKATLEAFERLWSEGRPVTLVIVGKQGWLVEALVERLMCHPELGKRLFWFDAADDAFLREIYQGCSCLIAASYGEGFGLPLLEAAHHGLPIMARDIPVFREVAGCGASYFADDTELASRLLQWTALYETNQHPSFGEINVLSWDESASWLLGLAVNQQTASRARTNERNQKRLEKLVETDHTDPVL
ncbi:glycosyltransferase [Gilvimarinus sp. F26214L]|uniref:glycosyltransferase n=1 Tax=Gilvimarinus sp. DZF01 TaxID=3461371 RepID=UPI004045DB4F